MKLYICGNGFDLNHGLATGYWNYREFLQDNYYNTFQRFSDCEYIGQDFSFSERWSDLENALTINYEECVGDAIDNYYPDLNDDSESRWNGIDIDLEEQTKFVHDFTGKYLLEWLNSIDIYGVQPKLTIDINSCFLTFNYTETLEQIYHISLPDILHIHGSLENDSEIQFGSIDNNAKKIRKNLERQYGDDDFYSVSIEPGVYQILSYCKAAYKNLETNYERLSAFISNYQIDEIVIMGHSYMGIDFPYYRDVIVPMLVKCKWNFFCHSQEDYNNAQYFVNYFHLAQYQFINW